MKIILIMFFCLGVLNCETLKDFEDKNKYLLVQDIDIEKNLIEFNVKYFNKYVYKIQVYKNKENLDMFMLTYTDEGEIITKLGE